MSSFVWGGGESGERVNLGIIFDLPFGFPINNIISLWGESESDLYGAIYFEL